jgi:hypothetical protein
VGLFCQEDDQILEFVSLLVYVIVLNNNPLLQLSPLAALIMAEPVNLVLTMVMKPSVVAHFAVVPLPIIDTLSMAAEIEGLLFMSATNAVREQFSVSQGERSHHCELVLFLF